MAVTLHCIKRSSDSSGAGRVGSNPRTRRPSSGESRQTVHAYLCAQYGAEYTGAWLAKKLQCSQETATELEGYLVPVASEHLLQRTLLVFAKMLTLDLNSLVALFVPAPDRRSAKGVCTSPASPIDKSPESNPQRIQISIGSVDGVHTQTMRQPTIVWRKASALIPHT
jgi:hypothetical protein